MAPAFIEKIRVRALSPAEAAGLSGLYLFAFTAWLSTTLAEAGLLLLAAAALPALAKGRTKRPVSPVAWCLVLFMAYVALRAFWAARALPETETVQWGYAWRWSSLALLLPCAFWIGGDENRARRLLFLAFSGLAISVAAKADWSLLPLWLQGARYCFGFPCLTLALLSAVCLLGVFCFAPRFGAFLGRAWRGGHRPQAALLGIFMGLAALLMLQVLITTQSRGVWLFFAAVLAVLIFARSRRCPQGLGRPGRKAVFAIALIALVLLAVAWREGNVLTGRMLQEKTDIKALAELKLDALPYETSIGIRTHVWRLGLRAWTAAPVFGWGPGTDTVNFLMKRPRAFPVTSTERERIPLYATHLHSDLIEALARLGLVGMGLLLATYLFVLHGLWAAGKEGRMSGDLFLFLCSSLALCGLFSLIDFRIVHVDYRYLVILMGSMAHSLASPRPPATSQSPASPITFK